MTFRRLWLSVPAIPVISEQHLRKEEDDLTTVVVDAVGGVEKVDNSFVEDEASTYTTYTEPTTDEPSAEHTTSSSKEKKTTKETTVAKEATMPPGGWGRTPSGTYGGPENDGLTTSASVEPNQQTSMLQTKDIGPPEYNLTGTVNGTCGY